MAQGRKILYFLGAGASYGAGATAHVQGSGEIDIPIQAHFWEVFLRFCRSNKRRTTIESFLFRYFIGYHRKPSRIKASERHKLLNNIDVEEVFTFLSERAVAPSTSPQLRTYANEVWESLLAEFGNVFRRFEPNADTRYVYQSLLRNHVRSRDAIVSFNYDTIFEDSLPHNCDWGYEGVEDCSNRLSILKPHGSINWEIDDDHRIVVSDEPDRCVVVAPTHLKFISKNQEKDNEDYAGYLDQAGTIEKIWRTLEEEMHAARVLVFIGYSFPVADLYFSSLLRSVIASRETSPTLIIVNPDAVALSNRLQRRFAVTNVLKYFDMWQFAETSRSNILAQID